jgi:hypothetical protein
MVIKTAPATTALHNTLNLNGSNQWVNLSSPNITGDFTLAISFYPTASATKMLFNDRFTWPSSIYGLAIYHWSDGTVKVRRGVGTTVLYESVSTLTSNLNEWNRLIVSYELSTGDVTFTLNGSSEAVGNTTSPLAYDAGTTQCRIGAAVNGNDVFLGNLSCFIYRDSVATGGDLTELQTIKQPEDYSTSIKDDYTVALPLNDGVVDPETDRSINGNDGTLNGSPEFTS